ncbi:MAG: VOC family protein [Gemmatimonadetes bacterium]|nr:VOC family protein [Gemmatimonadota bacterium]
MSTSSPIAADSTKRHEPESLRAHSLSASLTVKDLQKSLTWYHEVVGFTIDQRYEREGTLRAVALKAGDVRILIGQDDGAKGWDRVKGQGLSLQITTVQNVDEIAARIKELGGTLDSEPTDMPWGARVFRLQDPDGFKLTISSERRDPAKTP